MSEKDPAVTALELMIANPRIVDSLAENLYSWDGTADDLPWGGLSEKGRQVWRDIAFAKQRELIAMTREERDAEARLSREEVLAKNDALLGRHDERCADLIDSVISLEES